MSDKKIYNRKRAISKKTNVTGNTIISELKLKDEVSIMTNDCQGVKLIENNYLLLSK